MFLFVNDLARSSILAIYNKNIYKCYPNTVNYKNDVCMLIVEIELTVWHVQG